MEDFWSQVDVRGEEECWVWKGKLTDKGYGRLKRGQRRLRAHRVSYELHHGELNPKLEICHTCDNRACVNPKHLFQDTHEANMADCKAKGRYNHKLTPEQIKYILDHTQELNRELGEKFGVSHSTIGKIRRAKTRLDDEREAQPKRNVKLTDDQVREIKHSNTSGSELARRMGVSPQAISRIRRGKARKKV